MDFSVVTLGDVQNVLSAMQKNLECPIWYVKEMTWILQWVTT